MASDARGAYWIHLAESTSTKSITVGSAPDFDVLRHRRGENDRGVDALFAAGRVDPVAKRGTAVVAQGQRFARKESAQAADSGKTRVQAR